MKKQLFDPSPNSIINLFNEPYEVQPHPGIPRTAYVLTAGKSTVYQLKSNCGDLFAFKVFFRKYRDASIMQSGNDLINFQNLEGMKVANRKVILPSDSIVETYGELEYAVLMPWLKGSTWFDVLQNARAKENYINRPHALSLCCNFLEIMSGFERLGIAHTDIAAGNVMIDFDTLKVQVLDLEDIYFPNAPVPAKQNVGSKGYQHFTCEREIGQTYWCREGDRFSSAVLAAEILILSDPILATKAKETGFFDGHKNDAEANSRYQEAKGFLTSVAPQFTKYFEYAWNSPNLKDCPSLELLHSAMEIPAREAPINGQALVSFSSLAVPSSPFVKWEKNVNFMPDNQDTLKNPLWDSSPPDSAPTSTSTGVNTPSPILSFLSGRVVSLVIILVFFVLGGIGITYLMNKKSEYPLSNSSENNSSLNYNSNLGNSNSGSNSYSANNNVTVTNQTSPKRTIP